MVKNTTYDIVKAFEAIENELMSSMIRNMREHKIEEIDEKKQWTMWQVEQLKSLEQYRRSNQERFGKDFKQINDNIELLIRLAKDEGEMEQEIEILKAIKKGFKAHKVSQGASGEFFKLNERKLDALIKATVEDMQKAETAILRMAEDQYRKTIYNAQVYANTGAGTYEKAVDMATKDMLAAGLNCVEYANGARHTLKDYADMAIRTASKRAYLQGEGTKRQEWGVATVIVNKRGNPCPKCLPFCGKVFIDDVWSGGSAYYNGKQRNQKPKEVNGKQQNKNPREGISSVTGLKYPLMSDAVAAGLYHPRCQDVHTTYFEGINTPPDDKYTKQELNEIAENYRNQQRQQYAKRQEEKCNRLSKNSLDKDNKRKYRSRAEQWKEEVDRIATIKSSYVPAKTIEEAQEYAERFKMEREFSPRKSTEGEFGVNWKKVISPEYRKSLEKLSDNPKVVDSIEIRTKWALNNRDGLNTEELYAVSLDTGDEIASILGQQHEYGVERTRSFIKKLTEADEANGKILLIHNHPRGLPPSLADINALFANKNVSGITAGHDGSIYYYTRPKKIISNDDFNIAMKHFNKYTEVTAMEKTLELLSKKYEFIFKKL